MVCLTTADPTLSRIQELVTRDAVKALEAARSQITELQRTPQVDPVRLATLYALEAQSDSMLELDTDARAAARSGGARG